MISIAFSTQPRNLLSRLVRWFTKSKTSHAFIIFEAMGRAWILESGVKGVVVLPLDKFRDQMVAVVPVPDLTDEELSKVMDEYLGRDYDFTGLFGMTFNYIGRWLKAKWRNPWNNSRAMFCSELCVKALQESGFPGADQLVAADTSPQDLLDFLTEHYVRKA